MQAGHCPASLGKQPLAKGLETQLMADLKLSACTKSTRTSLAKKLKRLAGAGRPMAMYTATYWNVWIACSLIDVMTSGGSSWADIGLFDRAVTFACQAQANGSKERLQFYQGDVEDLLLLIQHSTCIAEQQAALKMVARTAAMSPADGDIFIEAGLLRVLMDMLEENLPPNTDVGMSSSAKNISVRSSGNRSGLAPRIAWTLGAFASSCTRHAKAVILEGGCDVMIRLLSSPHAAAQDAAVFTLASLIKWDLRGVQQCFARHDGISGLLNRIWMWHQKGELRPSVLQECIEIICLLMPSAGHAQDQMSGDALALSTQLVVSRGIHLLVELCAHGNPEISKPAVRALDHLSSTRRRFKSLLMRAAQDETVLAAIATADAPAPEGRRGPDSQQEAAAAAVQETPQDQLPLSPCMRSYCMWRAARAKNDAQLGRQGSLPLEPTVHSPGGFGSAARACSGDLDACRSICIPPPAGSGLSKTGCTGGLPVQSGRTQEASPHWHAEGSSMSSSPSLQPAANSQEGKDNVSVWGLAFQQLPALKIPQRQVCVAAYNPGVESPCKGLLARGSKNSSASTEKPDLQASTNSTSTLNPGMLSKALSPGLPVLDVPDCTAATDLSLGTCLPKFTVNFSSAGKSDSSELTHQHPADDGKNLPLVPYAAKGTSSSLVSPASQAQSMRVDAVMREPGSRGELAAASHVSIAQPADPMQGRPRAPDAPASAFVEHKKSGANPGSCADLLPEPTPDTLDLKRSLEKGLLQHQSSSLQGLSSAGHSDESMPADSLEFRSSLDNTPVKHEDWHTFQHWLGSPRTLPAAGQLGGRASVDSLSASTNSNSISESSSKHHSNSAEVKPLNAVQAADAHSLTRQDAPAAQHACGSMLKGPAPTSLGSCSIQQHASLQPENSSPHGLPGAEFPRAAVSSDACHEAIAGCQAADEPAQHWGPGGPTGLQPGMGLESSKAPSSLSAYAELPDLPRSALRMPWHSSTPDKSAQLHHEQPPDFLESYLETVPSSQTAQSMHGHDSSVLDPGQYFGSHEPKMPAHDGLYGVFDQERQSQKELSYSQVKPAAEVSDRAYTDNQTVWPSVSGASPVGGLPEAAGYGSKGTTNQMDAYSRVFRPSDLWQTSTLSTQGDSIFESAVDICLPSITSPSTNGDHSQAAMPPSLADVPVASQDIAGYTQELDVWGGCGNALDSHVASNSPSPAAPSTSSEPLAFQAKPGKPLDMLGDSPSAAGQDAHVRVKPRFATRPVAAYSGQALHEPVQTPRKSPRSSANFSSRTAMWLLSGPCLGGVTSTPRGGSGSAEKQGLVERPTNFAPEMSQQPGWGYDSKLTPTLMHGRDAEAQQQSPDRGSVTSSLPSGEALTSSRSYSPSTSLNSQPDMEHQPELADGAGPQPGSPAYSVVSLGDKESLLPSREYLISSLNLTPKLKPDLAAHLGALQANGAKSATDAAFAEGPDKKATMATQTAMAPWLKDKAIAGRRSRIACCGFTCGLSPI
ncbi:hypothetical protein WJX74_006164 [Apatococcus lobatus]|uniref:Uncharacterized protein n=1 Tax=Apatococcus lobatus TaxID=904363 RepID=A0AAW1Q8X7_9CHLO